MGKLTDYLKKTPVKFNENFDDEDDEDDEDEDDEENLYYEFFEEVAGDDTVSDLYDKLQKAVKNSIKKNLKKSEFKGKADEFCDSMFDNFNEGSASDIDDLNLIICNVLSSI